MEIISAQGVVVSKEVDKVTLPGSVAPFMVLKNHAPIISALEPGKVRYYIGSKEEEYTVSGGVACVDGGVVKILV